MATAAGSTSGVAVVARKTPAEDIPEAVRMDEGLQIGAEALVIVGGEEVIMLDKALNPILIREEASHLGKSGQN